MRTRLDAKEIARSRATPWRRLVVTDELGRDLSATPIERYSVLNDQTSPQETPGRSCSHLLRVLPGAHHEKPISTGAECAGQIGFLR